jgi:tRNA(Arg) A34 adenosine deaminase TadA
MNVNNDILFLRQALAVAQRAFEQGNLPFGCILVDAGGRVIEEGENTTITTGDSIAHSELNLVHKLAGKHDWSYLNQCTLYASAEPCPMCSAAVFWSGIGRIVYALSKERYHAMARTADPNHVFNISSKTLLEYAGRKVTVSGPLMEEEASAMYQHWMR